MDSVDREKLRDRLSALDKASDALYLMRKPLDDAIHEIENIRDELLEEAGVPGEILKCEECNALIFEGEHYYSYEDGPTFCGEHAPTLADLKEEAECALESGGLDDEEKELMRSFISTQEKRVADGGSLAEKVTYVL